MMFRIRDAFEWSLQFWSPFHRAYVVVMPRERQSASAGDMCLRRRRCMITGRLISNLSLYLAAGKALCRVAQCVASPCEC